MKEVLLKRSNNKRSGIAFMLALYALGWAYITYFLYWKEYDNNAAGAWASIEVGFIALLLTFVYLTGFIIAAVRGKKNRKSYLSGILWIVSPLIGIALFECLK